MPSHEIHVKDLTAASSLVPPDQPIVMLNLVHFRSQAQYPTSSDVAPCSGVEAYTIHYRNAFQRVATALGHTVTPIYLGKTHASLLAGSDADENWDMLALVKYSNFAALKSILDSDAYRKEAQPHRLAALEGWKFILTTEIPL